MIPDLEGLWDGPEDGWTIPPAERREMERRVGEGAATYGEILPEGLARLLAWMRPGPEDVFLDLGSGAGRAVLQVALSTPAGRACGIELSPARHAAALAARGRALERCTSEAERGALAARIEFLEGDVAEAPFGDATLVWMGSTCFPQRLMARLAARLAALPRLRALATTRPFPAGSAAGLEELGTMSLAATWDPRADVRILRPRRRPSVSSS